MEIEKLILMDITTKHIKMFNKLIILFSTIFFCSLLLVSSVGFIQSYIKKDLISMVFYLGSFYILNKIGFFRTLLNLIEENIKENKV